MAFRVARADYPNDVRPKYTHCETGMLAEIECDFSFETTPVTPTRLNCSEDSSHKSPASAGSPGTSGNGLVANRRATRLHSQPVSSCADIPFKSHAPTTAGSGKNCGKNSASLIHSGPLFQDSSSIVAIDDPVDTWALAQISRGNTDTRFLGASYVERKSMMERNMWPLDKPYNPLITDPPGRPTSADPNDFDLDFDDLAERRLRHRSENFEVFIVSDDEDTPLLPVPNTRTQSIAPPCGSAWGGRI